MNLKQARQNVADLKAKGATVLAAIKAGGIAPTEAQNAELATIEANLTAAEAVVAEAERMADLERRMVGGAAPSIEVGKNLAEDKPWESFGHFLQSVHKAHSGNGVDARLFAAATGMGEAVGADGGFAVPIEYAAGIEKTMFETGEIMSRVDARNISGNAISYNVMDETSRVDGSRQGGVLGYWVDEGTAPDATKIKLAKMELKLRKVAALGYMTDELQSDAAGLAGELESAFSNELMFQVENKIFRGTGGGSPLGFLSAGCLVSVAKETSQAAATINVKNLSKMWARLPARSKKTAVWLINVDCEPQLDQLSLDSAVGSLQPRFVNYNNEGILTIKGRPVVPVEYAETLGTQGDIALCDFAQYRLIRKGGVEQTSSMHVRFTQGENTYKATYRVDGQPVPRSAITPFKGTATLSPFVVLDTRA